MAKNSSTKDLILTNKVVSRLNKGSISRFKSKTVKNFKSENVQFFTFNAGFKKNNDDLLLVVFRKAFPVATVYSKTTTPSAPIIWDKKNNKGLCKVLIVNSGNANAHTGNNGIISINKYVNFISKIFNCSINQILVSSTGVIGEQLDYKKIINKLKFFSFLKEKDLLSAAKAIMTTDTFPKTIKKEIIIDNKKIKLFGFAKGSGMIFPNMGTMLAYIFIEINLSKSNLKKLLNTHLESTFNSITVDGDTSTSDTLMLFSIPKKNQNLKLDSNALSKISLKLKEIMNNLAVQIVSDGEGINKLMKINVIKAKNFKQASLVAFSVANSILVKTAIAGQDANWGRIIMAIGKSDINILKNKIKLSFGKLIVAIKGRMYEKIDIKKINLYMKNDIIEINIDLNLGVFNRTVYSSDLTHEYVRINSDYRS